MTSVDVLKYGVSSPADTSPLKRLEEDGYKAEDILAVIGKSEGNGCVNDFSRTLATHVWEPLIPSSAITIFSGGTEGVLSPHVTFVLRSSTPTGLFATVGKTRAFHPHEIGTLDQANVVAFTAIKLLQDAGMKDDDVHLVLVKCPLLTTDKIQAILASGKTPVTTDTYDSMAKSRYASAMGVAVATAEIYGTDLAEAMEYEDRWSAKASCSSGAELDACHILILSSTPTSSLAAPTHNALRIASGYMEDAIDARSILTLLDQIRSENGKLVQTFVKAEADPSGSIRGARHTMSTDSDLHSTRHARAAVGGLVAGLTSDTRVYVSGGAEGQGPKGGGSLCMVYRVPECAP